MSTYQLLYVSGATRPMLPADIDAILAASRANNARLDVTGLLLYADGTFIQILEGERHVVQSLAQTIRKDQRHRNFMVLAELQAEARAFSDWQMGFKRLDPKLKDDQAVFELSRQALQNRIGDADGGMMLEMVLAFAGRDFLAKAS
ncbi:BLUF domain-containing protein [Pararhizobium haloflavum]|uniref:BLUF domain-containing protein n=1 Tax=Pararhizobium haloflavum TaxID=2037914 RepID=UPI0012FFF9F6|nr:BLUF domain-containing protein [Pararhizobium haloflavum]